MTDRPHSTSEFFPPIVSGKQIKRQRATGVEAVGNETDNVSKKNGTSKKGAKSKHGIETTGADK